MRRSEMQCAHRLLAAGVAFLACIGCSLVNEFAVPPEESCDGLGDASDCFGVSAGAFFTCGRRPGGQVLCWGGNGFGQLGDGAVTDRATPAPVVDLADAVDVSAGFRHTCARTAHGKVLCWGRGASGQLGDGITDHGTLCGDEMLDCSPTPVVVTDLSDAVQLALGRDHTCALRSTGQVACWGANPLGQLGDDSVAGNRYTPVAVVGIVDAVDVSASGDHTCAVRSSGQVVCWGWNSLGQLGDGVANHGMRCGENGDCSPVPVLVVGLSDAVQLSSGRDHTCARRLTGQVACWGDNLNSRLGDGVEDHGTICTGRADRVNDCSLTPVDVVGLTDVVEVSAGGWFTCVRRSGGQIACWGGNNLGQLGNGTREPHGTPAPVHGLTGVRQLSAGHAHACALQSGGRVACWGSTYHGELGGPSGGAVFGITDVLDGT